ncbi:MAG TPA: YceI family protein [Bacteroidales bacterium]|nr:YceI family protein [Bacteroidales bacterium]
MNTTKWILDPAHSELNFRVKHLMITNVKGEFKRFQAEITGNDFESSKITAVVDTDSLSTNDEKRDAHLRSADFFDVPNHNQITFEGKKVTKTGENTYKLTGILNIRGIPKEVTLDVEFGGINKDPWGNEKAGFSFTGKINRKDWGLNWNAALETGGVLVGDDVTIGGEVQFVKQVVSQAA